MLGVKPLSNGALFNGWFLSSYYFLIVPEFLFGILVARCGADFGILAAGYGADLGALAIAIVEPGIYEPHHLFAKVLGIVASACLNFAIDIILWYKTKSLA